MAVFSSNIHIPQAMVVVLCSRLGNNKNKLFFLRLVLLLFWKQLVENLELKWERLIKIIVCLALRFAKHYYWLKSEQRWATNQSKDVVFHGPIMTWFQRVFPRLSPVTCCCFKSDWFIWTSVFVGCARCGYICFSSVHRKLLRGCDIIQKLRHTFKLP